MEAIMYSRELNGIKVVARQKLAGDKYEYTVEGSINGEVVASEVPKGFRETAPAARKMFKDLYAANVDTTVSKVAKIKMTPEEKEASMAARMQAKLDRETLRKEEKAAALEIKKAERKAARDAAILAATEAALAAGIAPEEKVKGKGKKKVFSAAAGEVIEAQ